MNLDDDDDDDPSQKELKEYWKNADDAERREMNKMQYTMKRMGGLEGMMAQMNPGAHKPTPPPPPSKDDLVTQERLEPEKLRAYECSKAARQGLPLVRTLPALLRVTGFAHLRKAMDPSCSLRGVAAMHAQGTTPFMTYLKNSGVRNLTDRQKLSQGFGKVKNLGQLAPCVDEVGAAEARLPCAYLDAADKAMGDAAVGDAAKSDAASSAFDASPTLPAACALKDAGNDAFKAARHELAIDMYGDAVDLAERALVALGSVAPTDPARVEIEGVLASLYTNTAASYLKIEQWQGAADAATCALQLDADNAKALYRRGVARQKMEELKMALHDLTRCVKLEPKNKEARELLAAIKTERNWFGANFSASTAKPDAEGAAPID